MKSYHVYIDSRRLFDTSEEEKIIDEILEDFIDYMKTKNIDFNIVSICNKFTEDPRDLKLYIYYSEY